MHTTVMNRNLLRIKTVMALFAICLLLVITKAYPASGTEGKLYLVGMGPGDPDLATVRAVNVIKTADHVICFKYLTEALFPLVDSGKLEIGTDNLSKKFYGKDPSQFSGEMKAKCELSQAQHEEFSAKIRALLKSGKTVAIADAGDPLIFGAWAWVTEEFEDLGVEVVPGVSSFNAGNAALGTDVVWGSRTVILTGDAATARAVTAKATNDHGMLPTLVFFTHRTELKDIVENLLENYSPETAVRIVCNAGMKGKETIISAKLGTIFDTIDTEDIPFLHLVYIGDTLVLKHKKSD